VKVGVGGRPTPPSPPRFLPLLEGKNTEISEAFNDYFEKVFEKEVFRQCKYINILMSFLELLNSAFDESLKET
jgi:hypothetical protein